MSIQRAPLKTDAAGKCTRWTVWIYNPQTAKNECHRVRGTLKEAEAFEREQKEKLSRGTYITRRERKTVQQVYELFLRERRARARRTSTLKCYESALTLHILPKFGAREIGTIRKSDIKEHFYGMREAGKTVATTNRALRAMKALMFFALESELVDRNVMQRFRPFERVKGERRANRGAFTEAEVRAILEAAKPRERALIGMLCFTGMRPGEVYALDWQSVDLDGNRLEVRRSWDHRGRLFVDPKTEAGNRAVPLSAWLVTQLAAHRACAPETAQEALVFPARSGGPLNPSNVRRDVWLPLKRRAGVRDLDLYSLRHTFVTFARAGGAERFNVARAIGHSRSGIVDGIYGNHTLDSGIAGLSESVTGRALGIAAPAPAPNPTPAAAKGRQARPRLTVIEGGQRDISKSSAADGKTAAKKEVTR